MKTNVYRYAWSLILLTVAPLSQVRSMEQAKHDDKGFKHTRAELLDALGKKQLLKKLLEEGALNARGENDMQVLHLAVQEGAQKAVRLLLLHGAHVNATWMKGVAQALHIAAGRCDTAVAELLLHYGAALNGATNVQSPLKWAIRSYSQPKQHETGAACIRYLLEQGAVVEDSFILKEIVAGLFRDQFLTAIIFNSSQEWSGKKLTDFLEKDKDFIAQAFLLAAAYGREELVKAILKAKSGDLDPGILQAALKRAAMAGHETVIKTILALVDRSQAWINAIEEALFAAAAQRHKNVVTLLLERSLRAEMHLDLIPIMSYLGALLGNHDLIKEDKDAYLQISNMLRLFARQQIAQRIMYGPIKDDYDPVDLEGMQSALHENSHQIVRHLPAEIMENILSHMHPARA